MGFPFSQQKQTFFQINPYLVKVQFCCTKIALFIQTGKLMSDVSRNIALILSFSCRKMTLEMKDTKEKTGFSHNLFKRYCGRASLQIDQHR